jgi:uncharacterized damage-inducible protein DinB
MKGADFLLQELDAELANTRRTLERIPENLPDYKPHDKSMALGRMAMHCATLPLFGSYIIEDPAMDLAKSNRPHSDLTFRSREECLKRFDESAGQCRRVVADVSDEALAEPWRFSWGEHVISNNPRATSFRLLFLYHMVHHVAQLGVYLRLNNLPVPGLYGPSADEEWSAPK